LQPKIHKYQEQTFQSISLICKYSSHFVYRDTTKHFSLVAETYFQSLGPEGYDSATFKQNPVFFARCEVESCRDAFTSGTKIGWRALPKLVFIPPRAVKGNVDVSKWIDMSGEPIYQGAPTIAQWISATSHHPFEVHPSFIEQYGNTITYVSFTVLFMYGIIPRLKGWIKHKLFWFALGMGAFAFSMAGIVYDLIHTPPFYYNHPQTKQAMFIYPSARQQFIAEGLIMAVLLTATGLVVIGIALVPTVKDNFKKRILFAGLAILFFTLYSQCYKIFKVKYPWYPM